MDCTQIYNNQAQYTPQKCEVDSCQTHVGQGGGQPHWHGDPFSDRSDKCLYGTSNYTGGSATSHPPVIGFSFDGHLIYGRYLSTSAPGFAGCVYSEDLSARRCEMGRNGEDWGGARS